MFWHKESRTIGEFIVFGLVISVACVALLYGITLVFNASPKNDSMSAETQQPVVVAPSTTEYDSSASDVMTPFLQQAALVTPASFTGDLSLLGDLVTKTEDRLLRLRLPAERRDAHLSAVLLLGSWKRAIAGSAQDQNDVLSATAEFVKTAPWSAAR